MKTLRGFAAVLSLVVVFALTAAAQVNLQSVDGRSVNVAGQNGKIVVLAIGASWLPLSGKQVEFTNTLAKKYAGKNVVFFFVATDSTKPGTKNYASDDAIRKFGSDNKLSVAILRDSDGAVTLKKYSVDEIPSFVILDKNGAISGAPLGGVSQKYDIAIPISKAIDKLL